MVAVVSRSFLGDPASEVGALPYDNHVLVVISAATMVVADDDGGNVEPKSNMPHKMRKLSILFALRQARTLRNLLIASTSVQYAELLLLTLIVLGGLERQS